jgi:hypothetical protein
MTIASLDIVYYTALFVLPGFVIKGIIGSLTPLKRSSDSAFFLSCLGYSIVNCATWSWAYVLAQSLQLFCLPLYWGVLVIITLAGAAVIAGIVVAIKQSRIIPKTLNRFGVKTIDSTPTAWDYCFSSQEASWVIITLVGGDVICGHYSSDSFASSDYNERDIYIEKVYALDETDTWIENAKSKGVYLSYGSIRTIEFLKGEDEQ